MDLRPSDFFLGVMEFFAVLLPGVAMVLLIPLDVRSEVAGGLFPKPANSLTTALAVLGAGYVIGLFLRAVGGLLDIPLYDRFYLPRFRRKPETKTETENATNRENGTKLRTKPGSSFMRWFRAFGQWLFPKAGPDDALLAAAKLKMEGQRPAKGVSTFNWAYSAILLASPAATDEVERRLAESKFFRSLIFVATAAIAKSLNEGLWLSGIGGVALLLVSTWQYLELRWKASQFVYVYYLQLPTTDPTNPEQGDVPGGGVTVGLAS